jgi:hypothetical protein
MCGVGVVVQKFESMCILSSMNYVMRACTPLTFPIPLSSYSFPLTTQIGLAVISGQRPALPPGFCEAMSQMRQLMASCLAQDLRQRPCFAEVRVDYVSK